MFKSNKLAILAALLSLLMLVSLMAVPAFADDATTEETTAQETVAEETTAVEESTAAGTGEATEAATDSETTTGEGTEAASKQETTTAPTTGDDKDDDEKDYTGLINLIVGGVILVALAILCIKFRNKIPTWWKGLKSECGKITWCPKDKLKKNTIVVVIIILAIAVVIGVLDTVFSEGLFLLKGLFNK